MQHPWYTIDTIQEIDSPALVIYPERVKENIRLLKSMIGDPRRLRPHIKTNKCKEAVQLMMEAGIQKFKCATIAEAELLALCKAPDVLLAYQPMGPKLQRFISLIEKYTATKFSALVDNSKALNEMSAAFAAKNLEVEIYIDLNLGMNRTGIAPGENAVELYAESSRLKGIRPVGLHAYDGHIRDTDIAVRTAECDNAFAAVEGLKEKIIAKGLDEPIIIAGGSPTFPIHAKRKKVECSPGTFIFWDKNYGDNCPEQPFLHAALVITRVISLPDATKLCLDLGHKSIAAENELQKRVYFLNAPGLKPISQSEEHLVVEAGTDHSFKPGDVLYGIPFHICPTVALYERACIIENNKAVGEWRIIARDRKINL
jgi:D-serine deaminase-like pyridoxal phosphate-dependent protein